MARRPLGAGGLAATRARPAARAAVSAADAGVRAEEIPYRDPVELFAPFSGDPHAALLHSAAPGPLGRWSFLAVEPFCVLTSGEDGTERDGRRVAGSPLAALREELHRHARPPAPGLPPFWGGAVGLLGYELARHLERVTPAREADELGFPELAMMLCDVVVALDEVGRRAWILASGHPERTPAGRASRARAHTSEVRARLEAAPELATPPAPRAAPPIEAAFTRAHHEWAVRRVIEHVLAGDVFQANLAQRFATHLPPGLSPFDLYRRLCALNPAPMAAFLRLGDHTLVSSSPERFLRLRGDAVETRPIKGTRPRGGGPEEDAALAAELEASAKDRAENVMIVDLLRNDLSRVCRDGSVEVPVLCALERFATVHHLVSRVTGRLRPGLGALDLLAACFPGGSITGAPKIRAMEIIAELEGARRGPYCGAVGYLGFDGRLDSSIVIRSYAVRGRRLTFHAGGGIVADSDPAAEYEETVAKARALVAALGP